MDEKYISDLYNQLGGQSKFGSFDSFKDIITTDDSYIKDFYTEFKDKLGSYDSFYSLVKKPIEQEQKKPTTPVSLDDAPQALKDLSKSLSIESIFPETKKPEVKNQELPDMFPGGVKPKIEQTIPVDEGMGKYHPSGSLFSDGIPADVDPDLLPGNIKKEQPYEPYAAKRAKVLSDVKSDPSFNLKTSDEKENLINQKLVEAGASDQIVVDMQNRAKEQRKAEIELNLLNAQSTDEGATKKDIYFNGKTYKDTNVYQHNGSDYAIINGNEDSVAKYKDGKWIAVTGSEKEDFVQTTKDRILDNPKNVFDALFPSKQEELYKPSVLKYLYEMKRDDPNAFKDISRQALEFRGKGTFYEADKFVRPIMSNIFLTNPTSLVQDIADEAVRPETKVNMANPTIQKLKKQLIENSLQSDIGNKVEDFDILVKRSGGLDAFGKYAGLKMQLEKEPNPVYKARIEDAIKTSFSPEQIQDLDKADQYYSDINSADKKLKYAYSGIVKEAYKEDVAQKIQDDLASDPNNAWYQNLGYALRDGGKVAWNTAAKSVSSGLSMVKRFDYNNKYGAIDRWVDTFTEAGDNIQAKIANRTLSKDGEVDLYALAPLVSQGVMSMYLFGRGGNLFSKAGLGFNTGTFVSSMAMTSNDYYQQARGKMSDAEASVFALTASALTSGLEMISPGEKIWGESGLLKMETSEAIRRFAMGEKMNFIFKDALKEMGAESLQEVSQDIGDRLMYGAANTYLGDNKFDTQYKFSDFIETVVATALSTGISGGFRAIKTKESEREEVLNKLASNSNTLKTALESIQSNLDYGLISKEKADELIDDLVSRNKVLNDMPQDWSLSKKAKMLQLSDEILALTGEKYVKAEDGSTKILYPKTFEGGTKTFYNEELQGTPATKQKADELKSQFLELTQKPNSYFEYSEIPDNTENITDEEREQIKAQADQVKAGDPAPIESILSKDGTPEEKAAKIETIADGNAGKVSNVGEDIVYHGSPIIGEKGDLIPSGGGELGAGVYFTRNESLAKNYSKPRGEVKNMAEAESKSGVANLDLSGLKIKTVTKEEYLNKRSEFYDKEQELNNGEWNLDVAKRAEEKLIKQYEKEGYDGLEVVDEQQGVIFPDSVKKAKHLNKKSVEQPIPKQESVDKASNVGGDVVEPKSYAEATDAYKATELGSSEDAKNKKQALIEQAETEEGKKFVESEVSKLEKNEDGTITVFRSGTLQEGHNPATTNRKMAEIIAAERKKQGLSSDIVEVRVNPSDISVVVKGIESEVFVKVDKSNKERIEQNTTQKQKTKTELLSERDEVQTELEKTRKELSDSEKAFSDGTYPFSENVFKDANKKQKLKIKNLEWQLSKIEQSIKETTKAGSVGVGGDVKLNNLKTVGGYAFELDKDNSISNEKVFKINDGDGNNLGKIYIVDRDGAYHIENVRLNKERIGVGYDIYKKLIATLDKPIKSGEVQNEKSKGLWGKLVKEGLAKKEGDGYVSIKPKVAEQSIKEYDAKIKAVEQSLSKQEEKPDQNPESVPVSNPNQTPKNGESEKRKEGEKANVLIPSSQEDENAGANESAPVLFIDGEESKNTIINQISNKLQDKQVDITKENILKDIEEKIATLNTLRTQLQERNKQPKITPEQKSSNEDKIADITKKIDILNNARLSVKEAKNIELKTALTPKAETKVEVGSGVGNVKRTEDRPEQGLEKQNKIQSWIDKWEELKKENDNEQLDLFYNKVKVALNGIAQNYDAVKEFKQLKSDIEEFAKNRLKEDGKISSIEDYKRLIKWAIPGLTDEEIDALAIQAEALKNFAVKQFGLSESEAWNNTQGIITKDRELELLGVEQSGRGVADVANGNTMYMSGADVSTALHEPHHHFLELIYKLASNGNKKAIEMLKTIKDFATSDEGKKFLERMWTHEEIESRKITPGGYLQTQELFATSAEKYFMEGKRAGFSEAMNKVFDKFKGFLDDIYNAFLSSFISNIYNRRPDRVPSTIQLSGEMRDLFDSIYGKEEVEKDFGPKVYTQKEAIRELKKLQLSHVKGLAMGANQLDGTYISTEPINRYSKDSPAYNVTVNIKAPLVVTNDLGLVSMRNDALKANIGSFDKSDFKPGIIIGMNNTIEDLNRDGNLKLSKLVTAQLRNEGYDSVYFPSMSNQEGELIVFDQYYIEVVNQNGENEVHDFQSKERAEQWLKSKGLSLKNKDNKIRQRFTIGKKLDSSGQKIPNAKPGERQIGFAEFVSNWNGKNDIPFMGKNDEPLRRLLEAIARNKIVISTKSMKELYPDLRPGVESREFESRKWLTDSYPLNSGKRAYTVDATAEQIYLELESEYGDIFDQGDVLDIVMAAIHDNPTRFNMYEYYKELVSRYTEEIEIGEDEIRHRAEQEAEQEFLENQQYEEAALEAVIASHSGMPEFNLSDEEFAKMYDEFRDPLTGEINEEEAFKSLPVEIFNQLNRYANEKRFNKEGELEVPDSNESAPDEAAPDLTGVQKQEEKISQEDKVKFVLAANGEMSIKDIAEQTGILEPNVRRILGVGTKYGKFERVGKGVYVLTGEDGKQNAYIEAGDAEETLDRMANEGKKFDMIFLDPAYFSKALIGGNRGIKEWSFIMPENFAKVMKSVAALIKDTKSHVYVMLSGARTAQKDMTKYVNGVTNAGFKLIGEGGYQKTFKDGSPVTNVRGEVSAPERLMLFTLSGEAREGEIPTSLNFRFIRPSVKNSYQTEKPKELLESLILQSTLYGEDILDPFAGSGVTGEQALLTGRKPTLVEKNESQVENIKDRLEKAIKPIEEEVGNESKIEQVIPKSKIEFNRGEQEDVNLDELLGDDSLLQYLLQPGSENRENIESGSDISKQPKDEKLFQPIGSLGAANLKNSVSVLAELQKARDMEFDGKDPLTIKIATGWERGVDRLWRYEAQEIEPKLGTYRAGIDLGSSYSNEREARLADVIQDGEILQAYPSMKETKVKFLKVRDSYYDQETDTIVLSSTTRLNDKEAETDLVHEIQHAIQVREGFAVGANKDIADLILRMKNAGVRTIKDLYAKKEELKKDMNKLLSLISSRESQPDYPGKKEELDILNERLNKVEEQWYNITRSYKFSELNKAYRSVAGEVESRNAELRKWMTPGEKREILLSLTEDVDRKQQTVLNSSLGISGFNIDTSAPLFKTRDGNPIGFTYDTDKLARERFDIPNLVKIGKGSDRTVFLLPDGKVLKVAHSARGLEQNIYEGDYLLSGIIPESYERGLNYVVVDDVPRIKASDRVPLYDIETEEETGQTELAGNMIKELGQFTQRDYDNHEGELQDVLRKYGFSDILNYNVLYADFAAMRNWGYKNGYPVHIDAGTFGGVPMIDRYSGKKNLSDSEFRSIYYQSRDAKRKQGDKDKYTLFQPGSDQSELDGMVNGFYSNTEKALDQVKQEKMSGNQWTTQLLSRGANKDEMKWTGLDGYLKENSSKSVSKTDIRDFLKNNRIQVVEVVKGGEKGNDYSGRIQEIERELESKGYSLQLDMGGDGYMLLDKDGELADYDTTPENINALHEEYNEIQDGGFNEHSKVTNDDTKFGQYQLEGEKENYSEVLVTMPSRVRFADKWAFYKSKGYDEKAFDALPDDKKQDLFIEFKTEDKKQRESSVADFKSPHFDEPNILVHLRMNTRTDAEGNKVLFLEEVQSDWGQKGKKEGFANIDKLPEGYRIDEPTKFSKWTVVEPSGVDGNIQSTTVGQGETKEIAVQNALNNLNRRKTVSAPFVTDTNTWTKLGLKVALKEAVKQGADKIAWSTGTQQFDRWGSEEIHWNTIMKPKGFEIVVKDYAKRPLVRGSRIKSLSSNDGSQDQKSEVKRLAEKWDLKPEDLEVIPSKGQWTLAINEQTDAQAFQGNEEALRSNKLEESDISVRTKAELRDAIKRNLSRERNEAEIDKLTDRIWNRMQTEDSGTSLPRKEGMEGFYGVPSENKLGIVGEVAKSLFKQEPKTVNFDLGAEQDNWVVKEDPEMRGEWLVYDNKNKKIIQRFFNKNDAFNFGQDKNVMSTQHSIDITPELKEQVERGLPLFQPGGSDEIVNEERTDKLVNVISKLVPNGIYTIDDIGNYLESKGYAQYLPLLPEAYIKFRDTYPLSTEVKNSLSNGNTINQFRERISGKPNTGTEEKPIQPGGRLPGSNATESRRRPPIRIADEANLPAIEREFVVDGQYDIDENQRFGVNLALNRFNNGGKAFLLADGAGVGKTREMIAIANEIANTTGKKILIVTEKKTILQDNFAKDAKAMGVDMDKFETGTYTDLSLGKIGKDEYALAIYDEAHNLKNQLSNRAIAKSKVVTDHNLYATATPMDKIEHSIYFMAEITDKTPKQVEQELGVNIEYRKGKDGEMYPVATTTMGPQNYISRLLELRKEAIKNGAIIRREYPFFGDMETKKISAPKEAQDEILKVENIYQERITNAKQITIASMINKVLNPVKAGGEFGKFKTDLAREMAFKGMYDKYDKAYQSQQGNLYYEIKRAIADFKDAEFKRLVGNLDKLNESSKFNEIYKAVKKDISEGRQSVVVAIYSGETNVKVGSEKSKYGYFTKTIPAKDALLNKLYDQLIKDGITVAKIYGGNKDDSYNREQELFQTGKAKVILITPKSGGTGINLDDTIGDAPRTMHVATSEYSGSITQQVYGRVSRRNTKSPAKVISYFYDNIGDNNRERKSLEKQEVIRNIVAGKEDLDRSTVQDVALDIMPTEERKPEKVKRFWFEDLPNNEFAVMGDTFEFKDMLKEMGATPNRPKGGGWGGWKFPMDMKESVKQAITDRNQKILFGQEPLFQPLGQELDENINRLNKRLELLARNYDATKKDLAKRAAEAAKTDLFGTPQPNKLFDDRVGLNDAEATARKLLGEIKNEMDVVKREIGSLEKKRDQVREADQSQLSLFEPPKVYRKGKKTNQNQTDLFTSHVEGDYNPKEETPYKTTVRGIWSERNYLPFNGTAKVKDHNDVANVMSLLESKSVEHFFAIHVDANGDSHIQLISIGGATSTVVSVNLILSGISNFGTQKIYLIHNHPSGRMAASPQDIEITKKISNAIDLVNPQIEMEHVIVDTYKNEYVLLSRYGVEEGVMKRNVSEEGSALSFHQFDMVEVLSDPLGYVNSSEAAVKVIQQWRFSATPKSAILVMNHSLQILANIKLQDVEKRKIKRELSKKYPQVSEQTVLASYIIREATKIPTASGIILYGNNNELRGPLINFANEIKAASELSLMDVLQFNESEGVQGAYKSAADTGMLGEVQEKYQTNSVTWPNKPGEPETENYSSVSEPNHNGEVIFSSIDKKEAEKVLSDLIKNNYSQKTTTQHSIDITPELKAEVEKGLPLFQPGGDDIGDIDEYINSAKEYLKEQKTEAENVLESIQNFKIIRGRQVTKETIETYEEFTGEMVPDIQRDKAKFELALSQMEMTDLIGKYLLTSNYDIDSVVKALTEQPDSTIRATMISAMKILAQRGIIRKEVSDQLMRRYFADFASGLGESLNALRLLEGNSVITPDQQALTYAAIGEDFKKQIDSINKIMDEMNNGTKQDDGSIIIFANDEELVMSRTQIEELKAQVADLEKKLSEAPVLESKKEAISNKRKKDGIAKLAELKNRLTSKYGEDYANQMIDKIQKIADKC